MRFSPAGLLPEAAIFTAQDIKLIVPVLQSVEVLVDPEVTGGVDALDPSRVPGGVEVKVAACRTRDEGLDVVGLIKERQSLLAALQG